MVFQLKVNTLQIEFERIIVILLLGSVLTPLGDFGTPWPFATWYNRSKNLPFVTILATSLELGMPPLCVSFQVFETPIYFNSDIPALVARLLMSFIKLHRRAGQLKLQCQQLQTPITKMEVVHTVGGVVYQETNQ